MLESLFAPFVAVIRWLDENPAARLAFAIVAFGVALIVPLPGIVLDVWLVVVLGGALGLAALMATVGQDLPPLDALAGLPAFLRRQALHRLALALAITKAILIGTGAGVLVEGLAQRGFGANVGAGAAALAAIYAIRLGLAGWPRQRRLDAQIDRLEGQRRLLEAEVHAGSVSPVTASLRRQGLNDEIAWLQGARQAYGLLGREALVGVALAIAFLAAGGVTGLWIKGWPLALTLSGLTLYGLAEGTLTALPGLILELSVTHWLASRKDEALGGEDGVAPSVIEVWVGKDLEPSIKRGWSALLPLVRTRVEQDLGLPLPPTSHRTDAALSPRGFRILVKGVAEKHGELDNTEVAPAIAGRLEAVARVKASSLLTMDATQGLLEELAQQQPVLVAEARSRIGVPAIHGVLQGLLREQLPIRDLGGILEAIVVQPEAGCAVPVLVEHARRAVAPLLCAKLANEQGVLRAYYLAPGWDDALASSPLEAGGWLDARSIAQSLATACQTAHGKLGEGIDRPALIVPRRYRALVAEMLRHAAPAFSVLAADEVSPQHPLHLVGAVEKPAPSVVSPSS